MARPANPLATAVSKALTKAGYDDVSDITIKERNGYVEIRGDSPKAYATAIANPGVLLNILKFADPGVVGVYGKAIIARVGDPGDNRVRRNGFIAHVPV